MTLPQLPGLSSPTSVSTAQAAPADGRTYSRYQEAIFACLTKGRGNVVVEATAGSGKSTTLVEGMKRWTKAGNAGKKALFCCFNKSIANELERRVPAGVDAKTLHGLSFGALRRAFPKLKTVDEHKLDDKVREIIREERTSPADVRTLSQDLCRGYGLLKSTMADLKNVALVGDRLAEYSIELEMPALACPLFDRLDAKMRADQSRITFDEMLSFVTDFDVKMPQYDLVMADECQDFSAIQLEILKKVLKPGGRLVAVGDSRQACYLFRGANSAAMDDIRREFNTPTENQLPLSITYRCPQAVVRFAQEFVPSIEAAPGAIEGSVEHRKATKSTFDATIMALQPGDMALCRANAPLVSCALKLLACHRRATIKGRDIGKSVAKLARDLAKQASSQDVESLARVVVSYCQKQTDKLRASRKDRQADSLQDKCDTLLAIIQGADSLREVENRIDTLFSDTTDAGSVVFSSIHRSKGLESDTVVWIGPEIKDWILDKCTTDAARSQEENLCYICITRAKKTLIVQPLPPKEG